MGKGKGGDLHIHSNFSDGTFSPEEIVSAARRMRLSTIALTDHDTTDGITRAEEACKNEGFEFIPGIELSTDFDGMDIHIVGLFVDKGDENLAKELRRLKEERGHRMYRMCEKLDSLGLPISAEEVFRLAGDAPAGRPHLAHAMLRAGYVTTMAEAFWKYIGDEAPAYVPKVRLTTPEAIRLLNSAGALATLCHPGERPDEYVIKEFHDIGIEVIEAFSPYYEPWVTEEYIRIGKKLDLGISGGSDFHGLYREEIPLGCVRVPEEYIEDLKRRIETRGVKKNL